MDYNFLNSRSLPFCKGCGHNPVIFSLEKALKNLSYSNLDVIVVTDIGCHGIIDTNFTTHTIHGLHGRAVALATGISIALNNPTKKIIAIIGDGGATIGISHIISAASKNINMSVIVHNNMLYGMTGGQPSGLTPKGFKTPTTINPDEEGLDICEIVRTLGASYVRRIIGKGDCTEELTEALSVNGFSLIEAMELCPSYAIKHNKDVKIPESFVESGRPLVKYENKDSRQYELPTNYNKPSLLDKLNNTSVEYNVKLEKPLSIMIGGSAGEGVQSAAEIFVTGAMHAGLNVTKKGSYPVTVGIGFSSAEIILSSETINYTGTDIPDVILVTSEDGLKYCKNRITSMKEGTVVIDESLTCPETKAQVYKYPFREKAGAKASMLSALITSLKLLNYYPVEALELALNEHKLSAKLNFESLQLEKSN